MNRKNIWSLLIACICSIMFSSITLGDTFHSLSTIGKVRTNNLDKEAIHNEIKKLPNSYNPYTYYQLSDKSILFLTSGQVYQTKPTVRKGKYCGSIKDAGSIIWVIDLTNDSRKMNILNALSKRMKVTPLNNEDITCIIRFSRDAYFVLTSKRSFFVKVRGSEYQLQIFRIKNL